MAYDNIADIYWVKIDNIIDSLKAISGVITSVNLPEKHGLQIFPNPSTGKFTLTFTSSTGKTVIAEICNSEGKVILKSTIENDAIIDLTGYPKEFTFCVFTPMEKYL